MNRLFVGEYGKINIFIIIENVELFKKVVDFIDDIDYIYNITI